MKNSLRTTMAAALALACSLEAQGPLTPPGAPAPTLKTLSQIEPRTDVQKLSGDGSNSFIINQPGAYYLTANIVGASGKNGISIQIDNVTLDLNGFALLGAGGALKGIVVSGSRVNIAVRNGTVKNWPGEGVDLSAAVNTSVSDLLVHLNSGIGIAAGDTGVVSGCTSRQNGGDNIRTGNHSVVTKCGAILSTLGNGINSGSHGIVSQCAANSNNQNGIRCFQRGHVSECTATSNGQSGVYVTFVGTVERSFCNQNANCGIPMDTGGFVDILNNNCSENGGNGAGIRVRTDGGCRIEGNNVVGNFIGIDILSIRNVILRNVAAGNSTDYNIVGGNTHGPIINAIGAGDVSTVAGANHPFTNFRY